MKKNLLLLITVLFCSITASAQWNTDTSINNSITPLDITCYEFMVKTNQNGVTYAFMETPKDGKIIKRLQIIDKDGKKLFDEKGILISDKETETFTVVDDHILIDDEGNAVILVHDLRNGGDSYTLYKYDEKGNKIWGDVKLNDGEPFVFAANSSMCFTDDGCYVVAFMRTLQDFELSNAIVQVEKFDKEGNKVWEPVRIGKKGNIEACIYPTVVNTGNGTCTVVYGEGPEGEGQNIDIKAYKLDAAGKALWGDGVVVYDGKNWGEKPLWTMMKVTEGPDNGVLVAWQDLRGEAQNYQNCLAYIKNDGTHGFTTGSEGSIVSLNDEYSRNLPRIIYDDKNKAIFCVFRQFNQARQEYNGLCMQKMSYDGERMWGHDGINVKEIQKDNIYDYCSIKNIDDDRFAVFYQENKGYAWNNRTNSYIKIYNKNGDIVEDEINFSQSDKRKANLHVSELLEGKYFLADWWEERRIKTSDSAIPNEDLYMQRIEIKSTATGIENVATYEGRANVKNEIFTVDGKKVSKLVNGVNIVRTTDAEGNVRVRKITR